MCAEKASLRNTVSGAYIEKSTKLRGFVNFTLNMAHEQVARAREIVARSYNIVYRTRQTLAYSERIQQGHRREKSRNSIMRPDSISEVDLDVPG
jgi:hypothetical protein